MSANRFTDPKLSETQELFVAKLIEPKALSRLPKVLGKKGVGEKNWDGRTDFGASIEYFGTPASPDKGVQAELKSVKLDWDSKIRTQALPHRLRRLATKFEQRGWQRTTSPDSVTVRLGGLSIKGIYGAETGPAISVEGKVNDLVTHKRIIEKLIEDTVIPDKELAGSPVIMRERDSAVLSYGAALIGYIEGVSSYQPGQDVTELISGFKTPTREPEQAMRDVA